MPHQARTDWEDGTSGPKGTVAFVDPINILQRTKGGRMKELNMRTAVVGIGGAGCNIISDVYWNEPSLDTIAINTDRKAMESVDADRKLFICKSVTQGQGTNGDSMLGKRCAQAHLDEIREVLSGYDVVYIVAGMGGGTGTGATPVIAEIAESLGLITSSILISPFSFETARLNTAKEGIMRMRAVCRMTTVIENDLVLKNYPDLTMSEAFEEVNRRISGFISANRKKIAKSFIDVLSETVFEPKEENISVPVQLKGLASL